MSWNTLINNNTSSSKYPTIFGHNLFFFWRLSLWGSPASAWSLTSGQAYTLDVLNCIKELFIQASNSVQTWANQLIADNVTREGCVGSRGVNQYVRIQVQSEFGECVTSRTCVKLFDLGQLYLVYYISLSLSLFLSLSLCLSLSLSRYLVISLFSLPTHVRC